jgi:cysteinyl-tRNA synthetase
VRAVADDLDAKFTTALSAGDLDGCVTIVLELEQSITDWTSDTLASDDADHARGILRAMVVRLGTMAGTAVPFVQTLVQLREEARAKRDFAASDQLRDALAGGGVEVRDTPDGPQWTLSQT